MVSGPRRALWGLNLNRKEREKPKEGFKGGLLKGEPRAKPLREKLQENRKGEAGAGRSGNERLCGASLEEPRITEVTVAEGAGCEEGSAQPAPMPPDLIQAPAQPRALLILFYRRGN